MGNSPYSWWLLCGRKLVTGSELDPLMSQWGEPGGLATFCCAMTA